MTDNNKTLIVTVLDRSGSMASLRTDMQGGFDSFVAKQKALPGECLVSLYQFDDQYDVVYEMRPIALVPKLSLEPRGGTALLDAVSRTIGHVGSQLRALPERERPAAVIVMIITDGHENASREATYALVASQVATQTQAYHWQFVYLGADANALDEARGMGIRAAAMYVNSAQGVGSMYKGTGSAVASYRSAVRSSGVTGQSIGTPDVGSNVDLDDEIA